MKTGSRGGRGRNTLVMAVSLGGVTEAVCLEEGVFLTGGLWQEER